MCSTTIKFWTSTLIGLVHVWYVYMCTWLLLLPSLTLKTSLGITPTLRSSVDGYKTVCPGEEVHFTCSVQNSNSLTWRSFQYIGSNIVIEFNRNFDRLGDGKSASLPNRETALLQLASLTDQELEATLRIVIVKSVVNASIFCANDVPESKQKILLLAETPEAPELVTNRSTRFYYFTLNPPPNENRVDIDFYRVTAIGSDFNDSFILSNYTSEYTIPLLYDFPQNISLRLEVIAVDRCGQQSPPAMMTIPANILSPQPTNCTNEIVTYLCKDSSNGVNPDYHSQVYSITLLSLAILMIT